MDPPPFSEGGQLRNCYTNDFLPGAGEQSDAMSDFGSVNTFMTLPSNSFVEEDHHLDYHTFTDSTTTDSGSLRQTSVDPLRTNNNNNNNNNYLSLSSSSLASSMKPGQDQEQEQQDSSLNLHRQPSNYQPYLSTTLSGSSNIPNLSCTVDPMSLFSTYHSRSQQSWSAKLSPGEQDLDKFPLGVGVGIGVGIGVSSSSTCDKNSSNNPSNFSSASPAATWSSPATSSFHRHQTTTDHFSQNVAWGDQVPTPVSVDEGLHSPSVAGAGSSFTQPYESDWKCEPLSINTNHTEPSSQRLMPISSPSSPIDGLMMMPSYPSPVDAFVGPYMGQQNQQLQKQQQMATTTAAPSVSPTTLDGEQQGASASETLASTMTAEISSDGPPYAQLIYKALMSRQNHCMTLQEIYQWFRENTDKAKGGGKGWQNSIRHNLSMNRGFIKRERKEAEQNEGRDSLTNDEGQATDSSKRSTDWTLEDWAIENGIQSTTRYRGIKDKDENTNDNNHHNGSNSTRRDRYAARAINRPQQQSSYYTNTTGHGQGHGHPGRSRIHPSGIHKTYRSAVPPRSSGPTSHSQYIPRTAAAATRAVSAAIYQDPRHHNQHYLAESIRQSTLDHHQGMSPASSHSSGYLMMTDSRHRRSLMDDNNYMLSHGTPDGSSPDVYMTASPQEDFTATYNNNSSSSSNNLADQTMGYPVDGRSITPMSDNRAGGVTRGPFDHHLSHGMYPSWTTNGSGY